VTATIWTIGYEDRSFAEIERDLADLNISMIIDVRADRDSRSPDFHHRRLEELATRAGIGYRWMGSTLGTDSIIEADSAIADLVTLASATRTVVLCRESDPLHCRRSTAIAPAVVERGITVSHLLPEGITRSHESPLPFDR